MKNIFTPYLNQHASAESRAKKASGAGEGFALFLKLKTALLSGMLLLGMLLGAGGVYGQVITVCPTGCDHTTLLAALQNANSGDEIQVAVGDYSISGFNLNFPVTLKGANAGIPAAIGDGNMPAGRFPETILTVTNEFFIGASDITIDGFHLKSGERVIRSNVSSANNFVLVNNIIENTSPGANEMIHGFTSGGREGWQIKNNRFQGNYNNGTIQMGTGYDNILIEENDFLGTGNRAIFGDPTNMVLRGNYFAPSNTTGINMNGLVNPLIENNFVQASGFGFQVAISGGGMIQNNTFDGGGTPFLSSGILFQRGLDFFGTVFSGPNSDGVLVKNNIFQNFTAVSIGPDDQFRGIHLRQGNEGICFMGNQFVNSHTGIGIVSTTPFVSGITVPNNDFSGTVVPINNGSSEPVSAVCSWWGTTDFATIEASIIGDVIFTSYLTDGTDTDPAMGFQPDANACDGGCSGTLVTNTNTGLSYCKIQDAIDDSKTLNGHTIVVAAGTYAEQLYINKSLTLLGPNTGVEGNAPRQPEAVITFPNPLISWAYVVYADADNVTIDGFEIKDQPHTLSLFQPILIYTAAVNDFTLRNNRILGGDLQLFVATSGGQNVYRTGLMVERNYFDGGPFVNSVFHRAMYIQGTSGTIQDNVIENASIGIQYMPYHHTTSGLIQRNTISAGLIGLYHNYQNLGAAPVTWKDNVVTVSPNDQLGDKLLVHTPWDTPVTWRGIHVITHGIQNTGNLPEVSFLNNQIDGALDPLETYNSTLRDAFRISNGKSGTVTLFENSFENYTTGVRYVEDCAGDCEAEVTATCNWWGTTSSSAIAASITGGVDFVPFIIDDTDTDLVTPGFQPVAGSCDFSGPVQVFDGATLISIHLSIQSAIDDPSTFSGYTIRIASGTYTENVDAVTGGKSLIFAPGASPGCVTINGNFTLNAGDVLEMEIEGTTPCTEHDQFIVNGDLDITGASLVVPASFFVPSDTDEITLFDVSGTRTGLFDEGTFVVSGSQTYYVNYNVPGSSDIVLTKCCSGLLDLGIFNASSPTPPTGNKLEVKVRPSNDVVNGAYSSGIFTIRTLTSNMVTFSNLGSPYGITQITSTTDATHTYYTFYFEAGFPFTVNWDKDTEYTVLTLGYACLGDAIFELTNASPTPNTVYYQELSGAEATGIFYQPTVTSPSAVMVVAESNSPVCETMDIALNAEAMNGSPAYTYAWTGPNGFASADQNPTIPMSSLASAGIYTVVATDANNCTGSTTTEVLIPLAGSCVENINTMLLYPTITQAINATATMDGHTLEVPAGNWPEMVNVTKELTINGTNAGVACDDGSRSTESVISAGLGTAVSILSNGVTLDGFSIEGSTGVLSNGFNNVAILNNIIEASILGIGASDMNMTGNTFAIQGNCIELSQQTYESFSFSTPLTLAPTKTAGAWYTDRYAPAGFEVAFFDGDFRLKHSINAADCESCRPGGFNGAFYNTQGRKYDIDGTTAMSIDLYVPAAWETTDSRMAGFWGTMLNASSSISYYPIIEFTSDGNNPRFRVWESPSWLDIGLPAGFTYDSWYTLTIKLEGNEVLYSVNGLTASVPANNSVELTNVILQGHNTPAPGVTYDIYWDNFLPLDNPSGTDNALTSGIAVSSAVGDNAVTLHNNSVSGAFYGYALVELNTVARTVVREGSYTGLMQGVSVFNTANGVNYVPSKVGVENLEMASFSGNHPAFAPANFHSGIYAFTGGADPAATIDILVDNVTVSNTGNISPNSSGVHFADFSTGAGNRLTAVVNESTISNNLNRGVYARGANAITSVTNSEILGNGGNPHGTGGNNGYGVIANNGTSITLTNNYIANPATQAAFNVTAIFNGVAPASTIVANENHLNRNGNGALTSNSYAIANFTATCNWWGSDDIDVVDGLVSDNVTFIPYLNSGTDTDPMLKGFQPAPMTCVQPTRWYVNDNAPAGDVFTTGLGNNSNPGTKSRPLLTIGAAVSLVNGLMTGASPDTIFIDAGGYDEQVIVPNTTTNLHLIGVGSCDDPMATTTTIDFTGMVSGKPTLLDVAGDGTVIDGIHFNVDLSKLSSAIIASDAGINTITIRDNCIDPYRFDNNPYFGSYGNRNAININHSAYRVSGTFPAFTATGNRISYNFNGTPMDPSDDAGFRAGIATDEGVGLVDGNILQTINHDVEARFSGTGDIILTNNTFNGGGVNLADYNNFPGDVTVSNNTFNGEFGSSFTSALRARNNEHGRETTISNNTFTGHNWGISLENYPDVTVSGNTFTPLATSSSFRHITVNTKSISTNSSTIVQVPINGSILNNQFNVNATPGGTALAFYNHDSNDAELGTFTVVGNTFPEGFNWAVYLGDQTGSTLDPAALALFPEYNLGAGSDTEMACWDEDIDIQNNLFDVGLGSGLQTPPTMNNAERNALEVILWHLPDNSCLGELIYFLPVEVMAKVLLQGPYDTAADLMKDDLRSAGLIPVSQPYSNINVLFPGSFTSVNNFVTEVVNPAVFTTTGNNAIVDWVWLELRDKNNHNIVVATRSALVQRDGDIVDLDGSSDVLFPDTYTGEYFLMVRHRNHLGTMTAAPVDFSAPMVLVDFASPSQPTFGTTSTSARRLIDTNTFGLWAGNTIPFAGGNFEVKYNGPSNDRLPILNFVGASTPLNVVSNVYARQDVNMDGQVKYTGSGNDRIIILNNIGASDPLNFITQEPNN